jgi:hypothetical protein
MNAVLDQKTGDAIARRAMATPAQKSVDQMQARFSKEHQVECPLEHTFTPGLYTRKIFMPKGTLIISKIHKTEHPFACLSGHAAVWVEGQGVVHIKGGHLGVTKAGTRRVLYMHEDTVWVTFHPTDKTDLEAIEADVIYDPKKDIIPADTGRIVGQLTSLC